MSVAVAVKTGNVGKSTLLSDLYAESGARITRLPPQPSPPLPAPVAPRHVIGKLSDPEHKLRIKFISDADPFSPGSKASALLAVLRDNGLRRFFAEGGTMRLVNRLARQGLVEKVDE